MNWRREFENLVAPLLCQIEPGSGVLVAKKALGRLGGMVDDPFLAPNLRHRIARSVTDKVKGKRKFKTSPL